MFSEDDERFMQHALMLAECAEQNNEVPVGAVLVLDSKVIAEGANQPISQCDPTAHAEVVALRAGARWLGNYRMLNTTLYVTLEPCAMCVGALVHARVKRVVFGAFDSKAGAVESVFKLSCVNSFNHKIDFAGGLFANECGAILSRFFKARR